MEDEPVYTNILYNIASVLANLYSFVIINMVGKYMLNYFYYEYNRRSLMKVWKDMALGHSLSPSMAYLSDKTTNLKWDGSLDGIVRAFQIVSKW